MRRNNKGFTIVELLVVMAIMLSILGVVIFSVNKVSETKKEEAYKEVKKQIITAGKQYFETNEYLFEGLVDGAFGVVSVGTLVDNDYLNVVVDPRTNKKINRCDEVLVTKMNSTYELKYRKSTGTCDVSNIVKVMEPKSPDIEYEFTKNNGEIIEGWKKKYRNKEWFNLSNLFCNNDKINGGYLCPDKTYLEEKNHETNVPDAPLVVNFSVNKNGPLLKVERESGSDVCKGSVECKSGIYSTEENGVNIENPKYIKALFRSSSEEQGGIYTFYNTSGKKTRVVLSGIKVDSIRPTAYIYNNYFDETKAGVNAYDNKMLSRDYLSFNVEKDMKKFNPSFRTISLSENNVDGSELPKQAVQLVYYGYDEHSKIKNWQYRSPGTGISGYSEGWGALPIDSNTDDKAEYNEKFCAYNYSWKNHQDGLPNDNFIINNMNDYYNQIISGHKDDGKYFYFLNKAHRYNNKFYLANYYIGNLYIIDRLNYVGARSVDNAGNDSIPDYTFMYIFQHPCETDPLDCEIGNKYIDGNSKSIKEIITGLRLNGYNICNENLY